MRLCPEGWPFVAGSLLVTIVLVGLSHGLGSAALGSLAGIAFLLTAFCLYFFRDPAIQVPNDDRLIFSPAYGKVMEVVEGTDASASGPVWILRIFLSVFDVHLQTSPVRGTVRSITYKKGKFLDARDPKAAFDNEQNRIEIQPANAAIGSPIVVTQVAGLIARRIVCDVQVGSSVETGRRIGLIRFGSQVDVVLPKSLKMRIKAGDRVTSESVIAEL